MKDKSGRLERFENALSEIANLESGATQNKAIQIARETLTEEYLGRDKNGNSSEASGF